MAYITEGLSLTRKLSEQLGCPTVTLWYQFFFQLPYFLQTRVLTALEIAYLHCELRPNLFS